MYKYTYSASGDFPGGKINIGNLDGEIKRSDITVALNHIDMAVDVIDIWFKAPLGSGNEFILDGGVLSPAGGLISQHDSVTSTSVSLAVEVSNIPYVRSRKPDSDTFSRIYSFSVNICDPTTWHIESEYIDNLLIATASGETEFQTSYGSANNSAIIDLQHGKLTEENLIVAPTGSFIPVVTVGGVQKIERECYEASGGDYEIDYLAGSIKFFEPQSGDVRLSCFHTPSGLGPIFITKPPAGKKWTIDSAEVQMSDDFSMGDTIVQNVFLTHPEHGKIKAADDVEYKRFSNFLDFTYGSYPIIPIVGNGARAMSHSTIILRWEYLTPLELLSSLDMQLRSWSKHGRGSSGERFSVTIYGLESDE